MDDEQVKEAMKVMDEGYLAQNYYSAKKTKIKLIMDREETYDFDTYSWTEIILLCYLIRISWCRSQEAASQSKTTTGNNQVLAISHWIKWN